VSEEKEKQQKIIKRPPRLEAKKALERMREFAARRERFVAAIRKSKN
jgi:hypothetical protein